MAGEDSSFTKTGGQETPARPDHIQGLWPPRSPAPGMDCEPLNNTAVVEEEEGDPIYFVAGVILSIVADTGIAISLNVMKLAHNRNTGPDGEPIQPFIHIPLWWLGISMNISGELGNLLAYGLAPASVVAPVGAVGVVVNQIIAVTFLHEAWRWRDPVGLLGIIGGIVMVILSVPENNEPLDVHLMLSNEVFASPRAIGWLSAVAVFIAVFIGFFEARYARRHVLVWLLLCSSISSLTVASARGFSSMVMEVPQDCSGPTCDEDRVEHPPCGLTIGHWLFWVFLLVIVVTAVTSTAYLNKAMQYYGNSVVVPVYYVTFTVMSVTGSAIVYNELRKLTAGNAVRTAPPSPSPPPSEIQKFDATHVMRT